MANYATLKAAINAVIRANGNKEITGTVLNETLTAMVNSLGANYQFAGVATPSTNPGTPDQNVFYIAGQAGTYTNFNNIVLPNGVSVLKWNGSWSSETVVAGDGVFDISAYKATGGTLATFADLSAALDSGNNIPSALRKGGMMVKFIQGTVQSSDNKYVQYRLTSKTFTTNVSDWQKQDTEVSDTLSNVDFAISDGINHDIIQLKGGGIRTKNFDSETTPKIEKTSDAENIDFALSDGIGHDIAQFRYGNIRTKHFDSASTPSIKDGEQVDYAITDENDVSILQVKNGLLRTKRGVNTLWGKTFSIMGDSISTYSGMLALDWLRAYYPQGDVQNYLDTWWGFLISKYGMILDKNDASNGSLVSGTSQYSMCSDQRLAALGCPDYILFMGGTNDFGQHADIGEFINDGTFNPSRNTNFANAYPYCLYKMKTLYPYSKIVCITIPEPKSLSSEMMDFYPCKNTEGTYLYEYNDVIKNSAKMMGCGICDITDVLNYFNAKNTHIEETEGGEHAYVHPNKKGMEMIANRIAKILNFKL